MKCGFCGCNMARGVGASIERWVYNTCLSCCVNYTGTDITHYTHVGASWKPIPEGCLLIVELEHSSEEIQ